MGGDVQLAFDPGHLKILVRVLAEVRGDVFEEIVHDLRVILRLFNERDPQASATIMNWRTLQSTPESGARAGCEGAKKKNGSTVHAAVDTMGKLLALKVTAANEQKGNQVAEPAAKVQEVTGGTVTIAFVDQGCTGAHAAQQASQAGIALEVVKHTEAK